jgi:hypothetical protein
VWDAARQELARVATLGVAGFDSPAARRELPELVQAIDGVRAIGLMTMPPRAETPEDSRPWFAQLADPSRFKRLQDLAISRGAPFADAGVKGFGQDDD